MIPLAGVEQAVLEHVPREVKVTVTTSPRKGLEPTLDMVERLAGHGYDVVPHLAARHVRDASHLAELTDRLRAVGASDVLVMAGDAEQPVGEYEGALPLLRALTELGSPFAEVGITGHPESHAFLSGDAAFAALAEKAEHATYVVTQICFDPQVTADWMRAIWERGTRLPVLVGLPGPAPCAKLLRISQRIGVGESQEVLRGRTAEDFDPAPLVRELQQALGEWSANVGGFHVFTFNDLEGSERWRRSELQRRAA